MARLLQVKALSEEVQTLRKQLEDAKAREAAVKNREGIAMRQVAEVNESITDHIKTNEALQVWHARAARALNPIWVLQARAAPVRTLQRMCAWAAACWWRRGFAGCCSSSPKTPAIPFVCTTHHDVVVP